MARIIIVGGYGAVGSALAAHLSQAGHAVVIAGRRLAAAQAVAARLHVEARQLDLGDAATWDAALLGIEVAVMCVDTADASFASHLFERGVHYVDLSADDGHLRRIEALPPPTASTALLSVGLAPGLSNILARQVAAASPDQPLRIGLLFGMNDSHGAAALDWTIDTFLAQRDRRSAQLHWGRGWGRRRMYAVGFGDQYALMRTMPALQVMTFVGLDSRFATSALFAFARLTRLVPALRRLAPMLFHPVGIGTDVCGVLVSPTHGGGLRFLGRGETATTAALAALMIEHFLAAGPTTGTWHSHQVLNAGALVADIQHRGIGEVEAVP